MSSTGPLIVGLDFDGTIVTDRFPGIGEQCGAQRWIPLLQQQFNIKVILFTVRSDSQKFPEDWEPPSDGVVNYKGNFLTEAIAECKRQRIQLWDVNRNPQQNIWSASPKPYCHVYVDDHALGAPLLRFVNESKPCIDWDLAGNMLHEICLSRNTNQEFAEKLAGTKRAEDDDRL